MANISNISYDKCQKQVIMSRGGFHLVLASPGCGKTQILTERIRCAHESGIVFSDMLCLTFTNRAARGMNERIREYIDGSGIDDLYVGNVHRFCSKFLFSNSIIPGESSVIDEDDAVSILARFLNEDEYSVSSNYRRRREYSEVFHFSNFIYQVRHAHPRGLRIHPECITANDIAAMRRLCDVLHKDFTSEAMLDMYDHTDYYRDVSVCAGLGYSEQNAVRALLRKMNLARLYAQYKRDNRLLDFQDLLMLTYDVLRADTNGVYRRYTWIQVDEVQDLNPLQMAIIDELTAPDYDTVMYMGDEQQAIFSFMGAKMDTLTKLRQRCDGHIHHLSVNHRSPDYLLSVFNTYAEKVLDIDQALLPTTTFSPARQGNELAILHCDTFESEVRDVAQFAGRLYNEYSDQTTAVIVNANADAELVSEAMNQMHIRHFKVSGTDLLSSPEVKLLFSHLGVLSNELNFIAWARLLKGLKVFESSADARAFVRETLDRAIMPSDYIRYDGSTYLQEFISRYDSGDIVVFDTETTGLNIVEDDIVQIAAVKLRRGEVVPGSAFSVFIATDRPIPAKLGDVDNPIIEEMKRHTLLGHDEALTRFADYAKGCVLLGHNADYDYNILDYNMQRYCPRLSMRELFPVYFDSLRLVRLLEPELKEYKLKYLLSVLHLEGENSHLADDDVNATCSIVRHCRDKADNMIEAQHKFLSNEKVASRVAALKRAYADVYCSGLDRMFARSGEDTPILVDELNRFYDYLTTERFIQSIPKFSYITDYLSADLICPSAEPCLAMQLWTHIMEISTLKEADLCGCKSMTDRIFVTTIHKAKGLEFDNVIVFDAVDGRIPNFYSENNPRLMAEEARKFYVAISRAKRRLYVSQCAVRTDFHNQPHPQFLTRFMEPLQKFFN